MYTALQAAAAQVDTDLPEGIDYLINMAGRLLACKACVCLFGLRAQLGQVRVLLRVQGIACCFSRVARACRLPRGLKLTSLLTDVA